MGGSGFPPQPNRLGFFIEDGFTLLLITLSTSIKRSPVAPNTTAIAWLWRVLSHHVVVIILLVLVMFIIAIHLWLPQLPTPIADDPLASSAWYADTTSDIPLGGFLHMLGLFDLAGNLVLRVLLALVATVLLVRLLNRFWLAWTTRHLNAPRQTLPTTEAFDLNVAMITTVSEWQPAYASHCQRSAELQDPAQEPEPGLWIGDRNQSFTWLTGLIELGIVLMLLVLLLNLRYGWQIADIEVTPGESVPLHPYSNDSVSLNDSAETITLCCETERSALISSGGIIAGSTRLTVRQVGSALIVKAARDGQELPLQAIEQSGKLMPELTVPFPQERSERAIAIPDLNLFLRIVNVGPQQYQVQALDSSNTILLSDSISGNDTLSYENLTLTFRPTRFVTFGVSARPFLWLLFPAFVLILIGLLLRWRYPYFRLGVHYDSKGIAIRWQGQKGAHLSAIEFAQLLESEATENRSVS